MEYLLSQAEKQTVVLDYNQNIVVLENFVYATGFWDFRRKREVIIPFREILSVETVRRNKGSTSYFVYSSKARFNLGGTLNRYEELAGILKQIAQGTEPMYPLRSIWVIGFLAAFLGLGTVAFLGWLLGLI